MHDGDDIRVDDETMALARAGEELIGMAVAEVRAPPSLREGIEGKRARAQMRARAPFWRRHRWGLAGVAVGALVVAAIAVQVGPNHNEPSLTSVYAAAQLGSSEGAPAPLGGHPPVLDARVGSLRFPDWHQRFGVRAVGRRDDELAGRAVTTVFYRSPEGARLGYAVVAGNPLPDRPVGHRVSYKGTTYHVARGSQQTVVTWVESGHSCVIVAPSTVPQWRLVDLAASPGA